MRKYTLKPNLFHFSEGSDPIHCFQEADYKPNVCQVNDSREVPLDLVNHFHFDSTFEGDMERDIISPEPRVVATRAKFCKFRTRLVLGLLIFFFLGVIITGLATSAIVTHQILTK